MRLERTDDGRGMIDEAATLVTPEGAIIGVYLPNVMDKEIQVRFLPID